MVWASTGGGLAATQPAPDTPPLLPQDAVQQCFPVVQGVWEMEDARGKLSRAID